MQFKAYGTGNSSIVSMSGEAFHKEAAELESETHYYKKMYITNIEPTLKQVGREYVWAY